MNSETSIVDRLYDALVDEVTETRPELLHESFTVAEIYQNLVPYRTHRERVGAEMNGDYEHALLRLLAGEGDYVTLESDVARSRLEEELNSIHPDTGVYRNFAACEVRFRPDRLEDRGVPVHLEGPSEGTEAEDEPVDAGESEGELGPEAESGTGAAAEGETPGAESDATDAGEDGDAGEGPSDEAFATAAGTSNGADRPTEEELDAELRAAMEGPGEADGGESEEASPTTEAVEDDSSGDAPPETCLWCRESLPDRDDLRFCPYCGSSVDVRPCPECGAEVESDWIFCIACGSEAGA